VQLKLRYSAEASREQVEGPNFPLYLEALNLFLSEIAHQGFLNVGDLETPLFLRVSKSKIKSPRRSDIDGHDERAVHVLSAL
jgi:hypothetical protein